MNQDTRIFIRKKFKEYYFRHRVEPPDLIGSREFGVGTLEDKIKTRHKSFPSARDFHNYLRREAPSYISYSTAQYEFPANQPMEAKNWLGADLVFDLDRDVGFLDPKEFDIVREEAIRLIDVLESDFGFSGNEISINFSGSKGYHIHVKSSKTFELDSAARREIVDYVAGSLDFTCFLREDDVGGYVKVFGPKEGDAGWPARIYENLYGFLSNACEKELIEVEGIGKKKATEILAAKQRILTSLKKGEYDTIPEIITFERGKVSAKMGGGGDPNVSLHYIKKTNSTLIDKIIKETGITIKDTDKMVTIDTARLIRVPDTIHAGVGLLAKKVRKIEDFDPLIDALAFGDEEIKVKLNEDIAEFSIGDQKIQAAKKGGDIKVPEHAAMFLMLKDKAEIEN
ncbi:MAG: DNA primase small subunit PriS [Candidatus Altiarchaeota archaeon]